MKKTPFTITLLLICSSLILNAESLNSSAQEDLKNRYQQAYTNTSDINQHIPVLKKLAMECSSVAEIGVRTMVSTWALLYGLAQNPNPDRSYLGIDLVLPPRSIYTCAKNLAEANGVRFNFFAADDMLLELNPVDMLFIDSLHTYCHLTYELETFSPQVNKYIVMHDTSAPWGNRDDDLYFGDYSEYPKHIDRTKKGLWPAVQDFLKNHPEWALAERRLNNHGLTTLKRVSSKND